VSERPRYASWADVPADLRTANDLRFAGLEPRGESVAVVVVEEREIELYRGADATPREKRPPPDRDGVEPLPIGSAGSTLGRASRRTAVALPGGSGLLGRVRTADADPATVVSTARTWLRELLASAFVVIDTETTGLGYADEIIEISVIAGDGTTLLDTLVRPRSGRVPPMVSRVHGLTMRDLADAPTWDDIYDEVLAVTTDRRVIAWNAPFDERMVRQSATAWSRTERLRGFECAMQAYAFCSGARFGRAKLERAAAALGLLGGVAQSHRSEADARLTLAVLRATLARPV
jgi:DNA polymerase III subunit epsilon